MGQLSTGTEEPAPADCPCHNDAVVICVVEYREEWPVKFEAVAESLRCALAAVPIRSIEHVGSTAVPGLAAKPILDIDVIVAAEHIPAAIAALEASGYEHRGDLGLSGREAMGAPDVDPERHVYVCQDGSLHVRNHLAVRQVLREQPGLRDRYAAAKLGLSADDEMDITRYIAGKSAVLQEVLSLSDLTDAEKAEIHQLNTGI